MLSSCYILSRHSVNQWWCRVGVSKLGSTHLIFVDPGVKTKWGLLPWCTSHAGDVASHTRDFWGVFHPTAGQHSCAQSSRYSETSGTGNPSIHLSRNVAAKFTRSKPGRLSDLGGDAAACVSEENKHRGRVEAAPGWRLARHAAICAWQRNRRVAQASQSLYSRQRRTFWAYAVTVDSTCITSFVSCVLLLVKSWISEHSVAIDLLKLNIFNRAHFQALL